MNIKWHLKGAGKTFTGEANLSLNGTKTWYVENEKIYHVFCPGGFIYETQVEEDFEGVILMLSSVLTGIEERIRLDDVGEIGVVHTNVRVINPLSESNRLRKST